MHELHLDVSEHLKSVSWASLPPVPYIVDMEGMLILQDFSNSESYYTAYMWLGSRSQWKHFALTGLRADFSLGGSSLLLNWLFSNNCVRRILDEKITNVSIWCFLSFVDMCIMDCTYRVLQEEESESHVLRSFAWFPFHKFTASWILKRNCPQWKEMWENWITK